MNFKGEYMMNKIISICSLSFVAFTFAEVVSAPNLDDPRDGKTYKTIRIENQVWMAENLNFDTHNSFCYHNDDKECAKLGRFYTWRAALNACPQGWRLPSRSDWMTLKTLVKNEDRLYLWDDDVPEIGYQVSAPNFNAYTVGFRDPYGNFDKEGISYYWTSSKESSDDQGNALCTTIDDLDPQKTKCAKSRYFGMTVRCIQGEESSPTSKEKYSVIQGKFVDSRDKKEYKTVQINQQTWLAENLNFETKNSYCHNNDPLECEKYGRLYKWEDAEKACPAGWHLPSRYEIKRLLWAVGDDSGEKLKSRNGWESNNGWDELGFNVLPVGNAQLSENKIDRFDPNGHAVAFWTSTHNEKYYYKWFFFNDNWVSKLDETQADWVAEPIRCMKNYEVDAVAVGTFKDKRDKKVYKTVTIGNQKWMAENLAYNEKGSSCYANDKRNCKEYGRLYSWNQIKDLCPMGWHIPSKDEWRVLFAYVDNNASILKSKTNWPKKNGLDELGFNALPSGSTVKNDFGKSAYFWTTDSRNDKAEAMELLDYLDVASFGRHTFNDGLSVRCLADSEKKRE